jgi:hypothetical protein
MHCISLAVFTPRVSVRMVDYVYVAFTLLTDVKSNSLENHSIEFGFFWLSVETYLTNVVTKYE